MSYFHTISYDPSNVKYNTEFPVYLAGTTSSIPVKPAKYYGNVFVTVAVPGTKGYKKIYLPELPIIDIDPGHIISNIRDAIIQYRQREMGLM